MHRVFNCLSFICILVDQVDQSVMQEKRKSKWLENVSKVAKKINQKRKLVKSYSITVPVFFDKFEKLLTDSDIKRLLLTILSSYFKGLKSFLLSVLHTSPEVCAHTFEAEARCFLAASSLFIFGSHLITSYIYQVATLQRFYIMKIKQDSELIGCRIGLHNISDDVVEDHHLHGKQGKFLFSGGKGGPTGKIEYQKSVLRQQFQNEWLRHENKKRCHKLAIMQGDTFNLHTRKMAQKKSTGYVDLFLKSLKRLSTIYSDV